MHAVLVYKGYRAEFEFDHVTRLLMGRVVNMPRGTISFMGASVAELEIELARAVERYFEHCRRAGIESLAPLPAEVPDPREIPPGGP